MDIEEIFKKSPGELIQIAGPCSAETEEQVLRIARDLAVSGDIDLYRAGIWKPRTKPGSFEGVGSIGLPWLQKVQRETGLKVTTEVATSYHVDECLKHGIDVLWIGARTTVNPFSVQEIADALQGVDIPVLIKNPINPDLSLWIGAIERIYQAGIRKIAVIHRGFSSFGENHYRNAPTWQIPIELKRQFPDLTIITDHSHICGRRDTLQQIAQTALDLSFDGLMTEVHCNPDEAWSDAFQQIRPDRYHQLIQDLVIRENKELDSQNSGLAPMRKEIDALDSALLENLHDRMAYVREIGHYKKGKGISILQPERWNYILEKARAKQEDLKVSDDFIVKLFRVIHEESIEQQEKIMGSNK